ncbi:MAG: UPF0280 family protein [Inquilinaceae bacterium]
MSGPVAALSPSGDRLHLQHGPIDLIIAAEGDHPTARDLAFRAAARRFAGVLEELVAELPNLRRAPDHAARPPFRGVIAQAMGRAVASHAGHVFVTPMAAVAGAVADEILAHMLAATLLRRASVNNGGDIALHLGAGETFRMAISALDGAPLGRIIVAADDGVGGVATSGLGGRSLTFGIAQSVTVLARTAAMADVAATLIANAVDLPGHPAVHRAPACEIAPDSDLGGRLVVTRCDPLVPTDIARALARGAAEARRMQEAGLIAAASLFLQGMACVMPALRNCLKHPEKMTEYA